MNELQIPEKARSGIAITLVLLVLAAIFMVVRHIYFMGSAARAQRDAFAGLGDSIKSGKNVSINAQIINSDGNIASAPGAVQK